MKMKGKIKIDASMSSLTEKQLEPFAKNNHLFSIRSDAIEKQPDNKEVACNV